MRSTHIPTNSQCLHTWHNGDFSPRAAKTSRPGATKAKMHSRETIVSAANMHSREAIDSAAHEPSQGNTNYENTQKTQDNSPSAKVFNSHIVVVVPHACGDVVKMITQT